MHEKVGGQKALLDPALEKVGGQLTPLTPCLRGLDTTVRLRTTRGPTSDYCASPLVKPGLLRRCLLLDLPCLEQLSVTGLSEIRNM